MPTWIAERIKCNAQDIYKQMHALAKANTEEINEST